MKKLIIGCLLGAFIIGNAMAQFPCGNGITTDPNAPSNPQQGEPYFTYDHFLNQFDWSAHDINTIDGWPYANMGDFFGQQTGLFPSPYSIPGQSPDYGYLYGGTEADYFHEDGWELLYMNMGYYPDGTTIPSFELTLTTVPFVILYNKYKGVIRVFGKTTTDINTSTYKAVEVKIEFKNPEVSGLFGMTKNAVQTMDKETQITKIVALCNHPNSFQQWFHADFQVAYDPCGCHFRSDLELHFDFIQSSSIELVGRSVSVNDVVYDGGTNSVDYDKNFLTNIFKNPDAQAEAGSIVYKNIDEMVDDYIAKLEAIEAYNSDPKIKRNKIILKLIKGLKTGIVTYLSTDPMFALAMQFAPDVVQLLNNLTPNQPLIKVNEPKLKDALKKVLGAGYDQLTGFLDKKLGSNPPSTPEMPTAIITEMTYTGNLTTTTATGISTLFNPGTFNNSTVANTQFSGSEQLTTYNYPVYNEALGTFAMLYAPKVDFYKLTGHQPVDNHYPHGGQSHADQHRSYAIKYKLKEAMKYLFNPILNLNTAQTNISAGYVVKIHAPGFNELGQLSVSHGIEGSNYFGEHDKVIVHAYDIYNLTLDQTNPNSVPNNNGPEILEFVSPFVPIECLSEMTVGFSNNYTIYSWPAADITSDIAKYENMDIEIYIKLLIDYEYNDLDHQGNPNKVNQVLMFRADEFVTSTDPGLLYNFSSYPENLVMPNTHIPFNTNYQAWNNVTVIGNITQNNNVQSEIIAGNKINVMPQSHITPSIGGKITLKIQPVSYCNTPMNPVNSSAVNTFCTSGDYKAKEVQLEYRSMPNSNPGSWENPINLNAVRNGNTFYLSSNNAYDENLTFRVYNMSGKTLLIDNKVPEIINMESYSAGMYLFDLTTEKGHVVKKVIVSTTK